MLVLVQSTLLKMTTSSKLAVTSRDYPSSFPQEIREQEEKKEKEEEERV